MKKVILESKGKKYYKYALIVVLAGSMMVGASSFGEFLTTNTSDEALRGQVVIQHKNDIVDTKQIHGDKAESIQEAKKENVEKEVKEEKIIAEKVKQEIVAEVVKVDDQKESIKEQPQQEVKSEAKQAVKQSAKQPEVKNPQVNTPKVDLSPITSNEYVVKANDTLFYISQRSKVSMEQLRNLNKISGETIYKGQVLTIKSTDKVVSRGERQEDLYWLSRIIHAEAQGESYEGKIAVGNVILNRVQSNLFPNTIKDVVFDVQEGYTQFSPVLDGSIYNNPGEESIRAAKDALNGVSPVGDALYFLNPRKAESFWIVKNRVFYKTIGDHDFYH